MGVVDKNDEHRVLAHYLRCWLTARLSPWPPLMLDLFDDSVMPRVYLHRKRGDPEPLAFAEIQFLGSSSGRAFMALDTRSL